jgi:queuine/archaeosine tRNA-ribosyltransferase
MIQHPLVEQIIELFDGVLVDEYGWRHYKVDGKDYDIRFDPSRLEWACDCPAFKYRYKFKRKYCKHILKVQDDNFNKRYQ